MTSNTTPSSGNPQTVTEVSPRDSTWIGLGFAWELGYTITVPAVLFGFLGRLADKQLGTSPLLLFCGIGLAFICSAIIVAKSLRRILSRIPKDLPKKKDIIDVETTKEQEVLHELFRPPSA
jgi:hypothetical protein